MSPVRWMVWLSSCDIVARSVESIAALWPRVCCSAVTRRDKTSDLSLSIQLDTVGSRRGRRQGNSKASRSTRTQLNKRVDQDTRRSKEQPSGQTREYLRRDSSMWARWHPDPNEYRDIRPTHSEWNISSRWYRDKVHSEQHIEEWTGRLIYPKNRDTKKILTWQTSLSSDLQIKWTIFIGRSCQLKWHSSTDHNQKNRTEQQACTRDLKKEGQSNASGDEWTTYFDWQRHLSQQLKRQNAEKKKAERWIE